MVLCIGTSVWKNWRMVCKRLATPVLCSTTFCEQHTVGQGCQSHLVLWAIFTHLDVTQARQFRPWWYSRYFHLLFLHSTATRRNLTFFGIYKHVNIWYHRLCSGNFYVELGCASVNWDRNRDLFVKENSCSQTYVPANIDMVLHAISFIWG